MCSPERSANKGANVRAMFVYPTRPDPTRPDIYLVQVLLHGISL